jgi:hypothetical protein
MIKFNEVDYIIAYEAGELRGQKVLELFSQLIKSGRAWTLQGCYGRYAEALIKRGYISVKGEILTAID